MGTSNARIRAQESCYLNYLNKARQGLANKLFTRVLNYKNKIDCHGLVVRQRLLDFRS